LKLNLNEMKNFLNFDLQRGFSHLQENQYDLVVQQSTNRLLQFFNRSTKEHRIEIISMLNYLIENFPFGLTCLLNMKNKSRLSLLFLSES